MRTHTWRKGFVRLSQRGQRLPIQRPRAFHSPARLLDAHPHPNPDQETATHQAQPDNVSRPVLSGRRSIRSARRPKEVAPFIVPDWFLRHNVRLHAPSPSPSALEEGRCWTLVDRQSGHTVLTLPFSAPSPNQSQSTEKEPSQAEQPHDNKQSQAPTNTPAQDAAKDSDIARAIHRLSTAPAPQSPDPRLLVTLHLQLLLHAAFSHVGPQSARFPKSNIDLHTSDSFAHKELDAYVQQLADLMGADLVQLDANDFADLSQDYVEPHDYAPGSISSLAYDTFKGVSAARKPSIQIDIVEEPSEGEQEDGDQEQPSDHTRFASGSMPSMNELDGMMDWLKNNSSALQKALGQAGASGGVVPIAIGELPKSQDQPSVAAARESAPANISSWDELKLTSLLDTVMDSVQLKRDSPHQDSPNNFLYEPFSEATDATASLLPTRGGLEQFMADFLARRIDAGNQSHEMHWSFEDAPPTSEQSQPQQRTIVHVRDMDHIRNQPQGEAIMNRLVRVVQRRRKDGEQVVILGSTASSLQPPPHPDQEEDELYFQHVQYAPIAASAEHMGHHRVLESFAKQTHERSLAQPGYHRLFDINMRHIHAMIRRLGLPASEILFAPNTRSHLNIPGTSDLGNRTLTQDEIQRTVICADSLRSLYTKSASLETFHIALAAMLVNTIDTTLGPLTRAVRLHSVIPQARSRGSSQNESGDSKESPSKLNLEQLKKSCSKHETRLMSGVVDPASLRTTFNDVHADQATIDSLKTLTSLTLLRPEAFSYGVLAADRLPGLLLYGPPGTGKTLLAKAVAKESQATVLEVSGAQVYEKYVGEGEKMVKAVFSLAKKLSPCVVFIDEADALFGSRGGANNRTTHREIINQFLREWDGMDDHSVFMMVATNRPFDLDDAVLRRLPRRLLVDLPLAKDREGILKIHLKDETLDSSVSFADLAKNTPLYSGSDLKNLCVAAALAAVRDENNALEAARAKGDTDFKLPDRRTLTPSHFDKAMQEISASVSEDMATLGAIRKFDEQYGERRARNKKAGYGFGLGGSNAIDETGARVRPDEPSR